MEDRLKELMQELGKAINESLSDSDRIAEVIGDMKRAGYNIFLVLECTIGFDKREPEEDEDEDPANYSEKQTPQDGLVKSDNSGKIKWSNQDKKFLKSLKIARDKEES